MVQARKQTNKQTNKRAEAEAEPNGCHIRRFRCVLHNFGGTISLAGDLQRLMRCGRAIVLSRCIAVVCCAALRCVCS
jgi:hypothetical protein